VTPGEARLVRIDDDFVVADKPPGLPAVPGRTSELQDCLALRVQRIVPDALVVHRLDMATSGLMLLARGAEMQRALSRAFAARAVDKCYTAVVAGLVSDDEGSIELAIAADWPNLPRQKVDAANGRPSLTRWRVLARDAASATTRLALEPVTGRTHQLRVHLHAIGHAIVGDVLYAPTGATAPRLLLHATALRFAHPRSGAPVVVESAPAF
jgi:tRNA pseudouridine32 synthase / 23S rRNA pseudouridine746 synthase